MGDEGAQAFADMLDINDTLKCLDLSANHIGDKGAEALGMMLRESGGLEKVTLSIFILI
jgi:Ran GTPase-activating protein (RanGAP) involved in mRNA processing and transport